MGSTTRRADAFAGVDREHPQFVNAVGRAFAILRCFDTGTRYLGNQEIAARTGLPKATVSRLTFTLSALGYLHYAAEREKYALGSGVLALGRAFLGSHDVVAVARPLMLALADATRAAVMLGAADGLRMVLLEVCQGDEVFQLRLAPGDHVPHGSTALGRAELAARPQAAFDAALATLRAECPKAQWPAIRDGLLRARDDVAATGFCASLGDWNPDVFAVGVPLVSADGSRVLALNCSGRVSVMTRARLADDIGPRLVALRDRLLALTGGQF